MLNKRPYFLWDYDLSEGKVKEIVQKGDKNTRNFLLGRILEAAKFEDVWKYISLKKLAEIFSDLKLRQEVKQAWEKAFKAWKVAI